jgi:hypothetical protein
MPATSRVSKRYDAIVIDNQLRIPFRIDEFGILSRQIGFGDPTGLRAAASNVNSDPVLHSKLEQIFQRRHRNTCDRVSHIVPQHERGVSHQRDGYLMPRLNRALRDMERQGRSGRILRSMRSGQK